MMNANRQSSFLMILLLAAIVGCGPGNPAGRQAVSGKVTLDGVPLDHGVISFSPESGKGLCSGTIVEKGCYSIATAKGLPPGKYVVQINSSAANPNAAGRPAEAGVPGAEEDGPQGIERIAPAFNAASKIVVEVVSGRASEFNFDTKSK